MLSCLCSKLLLQYHALLIKSLVSYSFLFLGFPSVIAPAFPLLHCQRPHLPLKGGGSPDLRRLYQQSLRPSIRTIFLENLSR